MSEWIFMMKSKLFSRPTIKCDDWSCSKCCPRQLWKTASNFRNFCLNFHVFRPLFSMRLSQLGYVITRWVLKMQTGVHKTQRMAPALTFLERCNKDHNISQSYHASNRWWTLGLICEFWNQSAVKAVDAHIHQRSRNNLNKCSLLESWWAAAFWDRKGASVVEFMQEGTTIIWKVYCETIEDCVGPAIQTKSCGLLTSDVVLLHGSECPHTATCIWALLELFNWNLSDHPPYSLGLTSGNCHLFTYLKNWLWWQCFDNNEELTEGVTAWLSKQTADSFDTDIQKFIPRFWQWLQWEAA
jgi:hypothetical protein